ncbi:hypothetical protein QJQ45_018538, partial [Haematococcus lacustris]
DHHQERSAEDLAARLASSNGQGDDSAAAQVRPPPLHQSISYHTILMITHCTSAPHCITHLFLFFGCQARDEFHTWCSDGYMVKMNLSPSIFHPRLLRDPVTWWEWYGKKTPVLQQVAQRVLSIPATSAGVERLFSVFKFIWSDRRNRLLMGRMWAMAYVYFNTRALRHLEEPMADDAADVARWEEWMASQPVEGAPLFHVCTHIRGKLAAAAPPQQQLTPAGTTPELAEPAGAPPQQQQQLAAASTSRKRGAPAANKSRAAKQGATHNSVAKRASAARLACGEIA